MTLSELIKRMRLCDECKPRVEKFLREEYGGGSINIYISRCNRKKRNLEILKLYRKHLTYEEIQGKLKKSGFPLSKRQIKNIVKDA
jgi:hypothetical protein